MKPQLAVTWTKPLESLEFPLFIEPKIDGVRCLIQVEREQGEVNKVSCWSRDMKPFVNFQELEEELKSLELPEGVNEVWLDGRSLQSQVVLTTLSLEHGHIEELILILTANTSCLIILLNMVANLENFIWKVYYPL